MKTKIKTLMVILLTASSINYVTAQQHQRPKNATPPIPNDKQVEKMLDHLSQELVLNNEQEEKLSALFKTHFNVVKKEMEKAKKERESHLQEMENLKKDFEEKVNTVLSEEQQKVFAEFRENHKPPRADRNTSPRKE